jgi:hypothetical protein
MKYRVLFQTCPIWKPGELDVDAEPRRVRQEDASAAERYPNDYRGRIISVIGEGRRFNSADVADPSRMAVTLELTEDEAASLKRRTAKIGDALDVVPVTFNDRWGAIAETLRANIDKIEAAEYADPELDLDARRFAEIALLARRALQKTEVHTGAGLYEVGPGKTYSTIQSALDQLWSDQGSGSFPAPQYIRIFPDTYAETIVPSNGLTPIRGNALVIEGDPASDRETIIVACPSCTYGVNITNDGPTIVRHLRIDGSSTNSGVIFGTLAPELFVTSDCTIIPGSFHGIVCQSDAFEVLDCKIEGDLNGEGIRWVATDSYAYIARTSIRNTDTKSASTGMRLRGATIEACVISNCAIGIDIDWPHRPMEFRNLTVYDCTKAVVMNPTPATIILINAIFDTIGTIIDYDGITDGWPDEGTLNSVGNAITMRNNIFYSYTTFADDGTDQRTHAEFVALDRVDSAGDLDATDPELTDPANGDFSLGSGSGARNAGYGSGMTTDYLGTAFDPNEPDIGAWSSGVAPPVVVPNAPTITAMVNDGTGTSATATVVTDSGSKVFILSRQRNSAEPWTVRGSRTNSGDVVASGLSNNTNYESIAIATFGSLVSDNPSLPSTPVSVYVTDATGFYATIRQALYDWVDGELGINTIWQHPNAAQPAKPYVTLKMGPTQAQGWDYHAPPDEVNGVSVIKGDREFSVEVQVYGTVQPTGENQAMSFAEQLSGSLQKPSQVALFTAAGCAYVNRIALTDLTGIGGTEFEARVSAEFLFRMAQEDTDTVGVIETVDDIDGTLDL